ncbi:hypothetical protein B0H14DRAFT_3453151 [Mycena olivaceomarginata]|nr:hypothetical protein B0H14DRAFT_3453151 [Mycena olivaceomarginata]
MTKTTNDASSSSSPTSTCLSTGAICGSTSPATLYLYAVPVFTFLVIRHVIATGQWVPPPRTRPTTELPNLKKSHIFDAHLNLNLGSATLPESELLKQWEWMMLFESDAVRGIPSPPAPEPAYQTAAQHNNLVAPAVVSPYPKYFHAGDASSDPLISLFLPPPPSAEVAPMITLSERHASTLRADIAYIILMPAQYNDNNAHPKIIQPEKEKGQLPLLESGVAAVEVVRSSGDEEVPLEGDGQGDGKGVDSTPSP